MPHCCPWWLTYTFDNPIRRALHDPYAILRPYVRPGMKVADIGCGMGFFTVALADLVGPEGRVLAIDLQRRQLDATARRVGKAGVAGRVEVVQASESALNVAGPIDFFLAFWMVHEVPDAAAFFKELHGLLAPGGRVLVAEPKMHVNRKKTEDELSIALGNGFTGRMVEGAVRISWAFELTRR